jgi:CMP-N-acetylneuraminic acid synthetase
VAHIGIVPARGGSKRLPGKNIKMCAGKPLLAWTAHVARASRLERVILSTDDNAIAEVGRNCGLEIPFLRPPELAADETPMLPVIAHLLEWLTRTSGEPSSIVLLQPTSPLRLPRHIDEAIELLEKSGAETVVSVTDAEEDSNPAKLMRQADDGSVVRAETSAEGRLVLRNGPAILANVPAVIRNARLYGDRCLGYYMAPADSIDIDNDVDFQRAENLILSRQQGGGIRD